jgi:hypothetical protein
MSAIRGHGFGYEHQWKNLGTDQVGSAEAWERITRYQCQHCGELFLHYYALEGDIFKAMKEYGVKECCHKLLATTP